MKKKSSETITFQYKVSNTLSVGAGPTKIWNENIFKINDQLKLHNLSAKISTPYSPSKKAQCLKCTFGHHFSIGMYPKRGSKNMHC